MIKIRKIYTTQKDWLDKFNEIIIYTDFLEGLIIIYENIYYYRNIQKND
jgi:hypothetical protein